MLLIANKETLSRHVMRVLEISLIILLLLLATVFPKQFKHELPCLSFVTFLARTYEGCAGCMLQQGVTELGSNPLEYGMSKLDSCAFGVVDLQALE